MTVFELAQAFRHGSMSRRRFVREAVALGATSQVINLALATPSREILQNDVDTEFDPHF